MITEANLEHTNATPDSYCCPYCYDSHTYSENVVDYPSYSKLTCKSCKKDFAACVDTETVYKSGNITEEE